MSGGYGLNRTARQIMELLWNAETPLSYEEIVESVKGMRRTRKIYVCLTELEEAGMIATLKKLNALSEETCAELTATTKRRKLTERDHSIKTRLAKAREQAKQPTVAEGKQHRTNSKGKGDMAL